MKKLFALLLAFLLVIPIGCAEQTRDGGESMANMLYNGVELPDINEVWTDELKAQYPYASIDVNDASSLTDGSPSFVATLYLFEAKPIATTASNGSINYSENAVKYSYYTNNQKVKETFEGLGYAIGLNEWASISDNPDTLPIKADTAVWVNFDVLNADGSVYRAASEPVSAENVKVYYDGTETVVYNSAFGAYVSGELLNEPGPSVGDTVYTVWNGTTYEDVVTTAASFGNAPMFGDLTLTTRPYVIGYMDVDGDGTAGWFFATGTSGDHTLKVFSLVEGNEETAVVTTSNGNGYALYNGVKLPNIDSVWDKEMYPYALYASQEGISGLLLTKNPCIMTDSGLNSNGAFYIYSVDDSEAWAYYWDGDSAYTFPFDSPVWASYDIADESGAIQISASDPIPLDGMTVIEWNGKTGGLAWSNDDFAEIAPYAWAENAVAVLNRSGALTVGTDFTVPSTNVWSVWDADETLLAAAIPSDNIRVYSSSDGYVSLLAYTDTIADLKPVYLRINGAWVKQTAYERQNGGWVLISTAEKAETEETATMLYNGVELPSLPEWDKTTYPYAAIVEDRNSLGTYLDTYLVCTQTVVSYNGSYFVTDMGGTSDLHTFSLDGSAWKDRGHYYMGLDAVSDASTSTWIWTNTDILNADGSVYLAASDPEPV